MDKADFNSNEEVQCLKASLSEKAHYLEKKYSLFDNSPESKLLLKDAIHEAIESKRIDQNVQEDCLSIYIGMTAVCSIFLIYEDYPNFFSCMALADAALLICLGIP